MQDLRVIDGLAPERFGLPYRRSLNTLFFLACAGGLGFAYYAQFYLGLEPCPLCIFQRLALFALGIVFLLATVHNPNDWGARVYGVLIGLVAATGAGIAGRHVWLQHLPPEQAPRCGPGLDYLLETLPLSETVREVLTGSGECAKVDWTLLGLSIPEWTLPLFLGLGVLGVFANWWRRG
ncbi:MAG: disulfide bond formation protein B [Candidatus Contendobacter sp.]|nr:disulfide bond formation protein B [Candidatus Contendobacter sp.]MDS4057417.1 disulfide bond formation protein B [Candidatus Contendobacter sp.]